MKKDNEKNDNEKMIQLVHITRIGTGLYICVVLDFSV